MQAIILANGGSLITSDRKQMKPLILDSALGTELENRGEYLPSFKTSIWSAYSLIHNPEVIKQITIEKTVEMMEGFGSSDEVIDATIEGVEKGIDDSTTPMGLIKSSPWGLLFLALLSLLTSAFIKKNREISDRVN